MCGHVRPSAWGTLSGGNEAGGSSVGELQRQSWATQMPGFLPPVAQPDPDAVAVCGVTSACGPVGGPVRRPSGASGCGRLVETTGM